MANQNFPPRQSAQYATSSKQSHPQATSHQPPTTTYPSNRFDTIVIGVGGMGSATCYQLARRGQRVLGLERFDIPHDRGSSHGYTRIIRLPYYEDSSYVMLLLRAYELWRDIERRYGQHHASEQLLHLHGSIDAGPAESWVFKGALQSAIEFDLPHEVLTGLELAQRFPGYGLPQDQLALYQPQGGFLVPERCIVAFAFEAMRLGAQIHGREAVLGWEPLGNHEGVRVHTERAVYEADSLVISAGSWNDQMLGFLQGLAVPERQVLAWFQPERPELFQPDNFPVFNLLVDEGRFYGFPIHGVPGFKIGKYHHFEEHGRPDKLDRERDVGGRAGAARRHGQILPAGGGRNPIALDLPLYQLARRPLPDRPAPRVSAGQLRLSLHGPRLQIRQRHRRNPSRLGPASPEPPRD